MRVEECEEDAAHLMVATDFTPDTHDSHLRAVNYPNY
jgi:hypothetical protein